MLGKKDLRIAELSRLLREISAHPRERQDEAYRDNDSVRMKLINFRYIETDGAHGMSGGSKGDAAVWREFVDDLPRLHAEATAIRSLLHEGVIRPVSERATMEDTDIEEQHTETFMTNPSGEPRKTVRAEGQLVSRYRDYMAAKGIVVNRKKYVPASEVMPLYCDAWVESRRILIEAKNSDSRDAIRQAIGQLYDYRRFHESPVLRLAVLLPYQPNSDRLALLRSAGIEALWPYGTGFRDSANGVFI